MPNAVRTSRILFGFFIFLLLTAETPQAGFVNGIDSENLLLALPFYNEPPSINSLTAGSVYTPASMLMHVQEGLLRYDQNRNLVAGVADRWEISNETVHFWLREDAKWSDGSAVTAHDFVFAWQELVNPATAVSSSILASPILNADKIISGELPPDRLGVHAVNDHELVVTLAHPCTWFLKLMANARFYPIKREFYLAVGSQAYGTSPASSLANGAFMVTRWERANRIHLRKNPFYWRRSQVHINGLNFDYLTSDYGALYNLFKSGAIAATFVNGETALAAATQGYHLKTYPTGILSYLNFNFMQDHASSSVYLRKAIACALDKNELVDRVLAMPGTRVANSMFPSWLRSGDQIFSRRYPPSATLTNAQKAMVYFEQFKKTTDGEELPVVSLMVIDDVQSRKTAEYIQAKLKSVLGLDVRVDVQEMKASFDRANRGQFDIHLAGWVVDFDDPMDLVSFMGNPSIFTPAQYQGRDLVDLYLLARGSPDAENRMKLFAEIQQLIEDKAIQIPLYEGSVGYLFNPLVRGFIWHPSRSVADYRYVNIGG